MINSRAGFQALKFAYLVLVAGLGVAAFLGVGSYMYWDLEKKNSQQSERSMKDLRSRLDTARRDLNDLRGSEATYQSLVARGMLLPEERLDLIEALAALKKRHQLVSLSYEVAPQRPLRLTTGAAYAGVNVLASRVKMNIGAVHEGHLVAFLDEFPRLQRGFFPLDRCAIKRVAAPQDKAATAEVKPDFNSLLGAVQRITAAQAANPALKSAQDDDDGGRKTSASKSGGASTSGAAAVAQPIAALEAECSLEWITLQAKGGSTAAPAVAPPQPVARPK